ncbi:hypothetical protein CXK91_17565 [Stutzerimonas stutzeri]|uniref:Copper resistance protein B n=1 Tax=Stutzerimonas stutzeri TaxID=316 RepID=A0A2S4AJX1_STUST|nr:hypothetical protein [Stutzerimonas stutzeri]MCQ4263522.1 hypothetical protein [Stutzerimonas stutzeri]MDH2240939.1 hypothetical protein [Pseudomonas sp. GD03909]POH81795.1 hypothetical protein CXK91_17565 [Stutzerimonas stutzeri]
MNKIKQHALLAFGLTAALSLNAAHAQSEHDGHHPADAPTEQAAPQASQPQSGQQQGGMMQGMDHDKMQDMHDQHMGSGHMDHGSMGNGKMQKDMPKGSEQGKPHDH